MRSILELIIDRGDITADQITRLSANDIIELYDAFIFNAVNALEDYVTGETV